jgi:hypothetical protein
MRLPRSLIHSAALALPLLVTAPAAMAGNSFDGLWCGQGLLNDFSLKLKQLGGSQQVEGTLMRRDRARVLEGSISGNTLRTQATKYGSLVLEATGGELKIMGGDGPLALARGNAFRRAGGSGCSS